MPGAFHGLGLASNALRAFQRALDTTGHNIANVNTPGYSRQVIDFAPTEPIPFYDQGGRHQLGTGVTVASLNRIRDMFLESRMRQAQGDSQRFGSLATNLGQIEGLFNEPGANGIATALDQFFNSWSGLSSNPSDPAMRLQVRSTAQTLANRVRGTYDSLRDYQSQLGAEASQVIQRINNLSETIASLNERIRGAVSTEGQPNDLMDQRDLALQELSGLINVTTETFSDGSVSVYATQFTLVDSTGARPYPSTFDATAQTVTDGTNTFDVRSGRLLGIFQSIQATNQAMAKLDNLANSLRTQINGLHQTGVAANGATNVQFFNDPGLPGPQTGAIDFDLSSALLASADNIAAGVSGSAGDGGLALGLSNLRNAPFASMGNKGFQDYYKDTVAQIGQDAAYYESTSKTQDSIIAQIDNQRQSVSGVSIDDEMANMLKFQRSYQAAAKCLTIFDQVTEDLIGMLKR